jgi:hypothetical protein
MESGGDNKKNSQGKTGPSDEAVRRFRDYINNGDEAVEASSEPTAATEPILQDQSTRGGLSEAEEAILAEMKRMAEARRKAALESAKKDMTALKEARDARLARDAARQARAQAKAEKKIARQNDPNRTPSVATLNNPGDSITMNLLARLLGKNEVDD